MNNNGLYTWFQTVEGDLWPCDPITLIPFICEEDKEMLLMMMKMMMRMMMNK